MSKIGMLRACLLELLGEHQTDGTIPTSNRFLYYELIQRGTISKERKGARRPDQNMNEALTDLRESGQVPWSWIVDETRSLDDYRGSRSILDWLLELLPVARLDRWNGHEPLILCESRSLAGVLRDLVRHFGAQIAPTNGQCGGFLHTEIAPILRPCHRILYLGDYDLAGGDIEANTRRVLERKWPLRWERLALTEAQVQEYDLPIIIKHDRRFADGGAHEAVETEALSQRIIVDIVRSRLEELLPEPLASVQEREAEQRQQIEQLLAQL
jgi:hypothetical protein